MPTSFAVQGPMLVPAAGQTFPDTVTGLIGGGVSYKGWWGLRAYSAAQAASQAVVCTLRRGDNSLVQTIRVTTAGVLNAADIALADNGSGLVIDTLNDQSGGGIDVNSSGGITTRPVFLQNQYGTNKHAFQFTSAGGGVNFLNSSTFPNTANNYIFTCYANRPTGVTNDRIEEGLLGSDNTQRFWIRIPATTGDVQLVQDSGAVGHTETGLITIGTPFALLGHFNDASSALNKNGADHPFASGGTNAIIDNYMAFGYVVGGFYQFIGGMMSEFGFMDTAKVTANTIDATKRSAITAEMAAFYV